MICPKCLTNNDENYVFCINCGAGVSQARNSEIETDFMIKGDESYIPPPTQGEDSYRSIETSFIPAKQFNESIHNFIPEVPQAERKSGRSEKILLVVGLLAFVLIAVGGVGVFIMLKNPGNTVPANNSEISNNASNASNTGLKTKQNSNQANNSISSLPSDAKEAYSTSDKLIVRESPSLSGTDTGVRIRKDEKVNILKFSDNYDSWKGKRGNWAYIETESGEKGWVYTPLLRQ